MFQYADRSACPRCRARLTPPSTSCPSCQADLATPAAYDVFLALQKVDQLVGRLYDVAPVARPAAAFAAPDATTTGEIPPVPPLPSYRASTPRPPAPRTILSGLTVPKILLGLGALCLVVAALVFLVVAWSSLGVAGRTLVLVAFTVIATGLAAWSARSGLRAGAESLTVVALGLLLLDLAGARSSGWFGDLGGAGFAVLAGSVIAAASVAAAVAARRTEEPRLISAEVASVLGLLAVDTGLGGVVGNDWTAAAPWATAALGASGVAAAVSRAARLRLSALGMEVLAAASWLTLAMAGLARLVDNPSWADLAEDFRVWPLLLAAGVAAAATAVRRVPLPARVGAAASAVLLLSALPVGPVTDTSGQVVSLVLVGLVLVHAAAAWRLPGPWTWVTAAPTALAGGSLALVSIRAAGVAATQALDHGLWTGTTRTIADRGDLASTWAFVLPVTVAATALAGSTLLHCAGVPATRLLVPGIAATIAAAALAPVLHDAPLAAVAACLVAGTAMLVAAALRTTDGVDRAAGWSIACLTGLLAVGAALVDDGTTVAVLAVLAAALAAAELRGAQALSEVGRWSLPLAAGALTWSVASMAGMPLDWRATPVIAVLAALALLRPGDGHEAAGFAAGLVATLVSATPLLDGEQSGDQRLLAAHLAAIAVVASTLALLRARDAAGLTALAVFPLSVLAAWADRPTASVVLALFTAGSLALEVRRVGGVLPTWRIARVAVPLAGAGLLWSLTQLAVGHGLAIDQAWTALPVVLVMAAVVLRWPSYDRDSAAGVAATLAVMAATLGDTTVATDALACYLALGALTCTASALMHRDRLPLAWGGVGLLGAAALVAVEHPWLDLGLLALLTATCVLHELRDNEELARAGRMAAPVSGGALLWVGAGLADVPDLARAIPVVLVLGALAAWRAEPEREIPSAATAALAAVASLTGPLGADQTWLAVYLTMAGVATTASSLLHETRRRLAWAGLTFFSLAQWLRLEEIGVETVEAYTLPLAVVLLVVGTRELLTGTRSSLRTQGAGLGLAVVPTLLQVLVEPLGLRAVLLGVASLLLIGIGIRQRWAAPLLAGGGAIAVLVLRQATHATVLPQWALIGLAGVVLTFVGLTWERRLADVRRAADYVRGLR